ncbi:molybdopterin converting factor subunit 1 [Pararcticibacter amylolyticus]|uniref:Molybdopterin synthase sulfur carrier subunit n=1 Tax=Pararcticibacter amylolyticus TaxID=2173175 RepID=A0A2U2PDS9_9SPHI|nr:molybdopterin converting factor subunit 1 [Pararcticibacter amylolyticus]PWG79472.1 molybdopterin converting factor subunit 1 [Pararcticibacter amylolyticus]
MKILLFGIAREIAGQQRLEVPPDEQPETVADLRAWVNKRYGALAGLKSFAIAVDNEYAEDHVKLYPSSEIALIPPVSGG